MYCLHLTGKQFEPSLAFTHLIVPFLQVYINNCILTRLFQQEITVTKTCRHLLKYNRSDCCFLGEQIGKDIPVEVTIPQDMFTGVEYRFFNRLCKRILVSYSRAICRDEPAERVTNTSGSCGCIGGFPTIRVPLDELFQLTNNGGINRLLFCVPEILRRGG